MAIVPGERRGPLSVLSVRTSRRWPGLLSTTFFWTLSSLESINLSSRYHVIMKGGARSPRFRLTVHLQSTAGGYLIPRNRLGRNSAWKTIIEHHSAQTTAKSLRHIL